MKPTKFIKSLWPIINKVGTEENIPVNVRIACLCQAALETGYGSSALMVKAHALFGIKATKSYKGKVYSSKTKEVYSGIEQTVSAVFKAYDTVTDSIRDYFKLVSSKRYKVCLDKKTVEDTLKAIASAGYATDPNYSESCIKIYKSYVMGNIDIVKSEPTNIVEPEMDDIDRLAKEVLKGKYGNGETRKKLLGTNYAAVQHRVNILLRGGK